MITKLFYFIIFCALLCLQACSTTRTHVASSNLGDISEHVGKARSSANYIKERGAKVNDPKTLDIIKNLKAAEATIKAKQKEIDDSVGYANKKISVLSKENVALNKAVSRSDTMILIALIVAPLLFWLGTKLKLFHPATQFIPDFFAGYGFLAIFGLIGFIGLKIWRLFGWLFLFLFIFLSPYTSYAGPWRVSSDWDWFVPQYQYLSPPTSSTFSLAPKSFDNFFKERTVSPPVAMLSVRAGKEAFSPRKKRLIVRLTVYWRHGSGTDHWTARGMSSTGVYLRKGAAAIDPRVIPYGSSIYLPCVGKTLKAVDTGSAVVAKTSARKSGQKVDAVVDIYFDRKSDALAFAQKNSQPTVAFISF